METFLITCIILIWSFLGYTVKMTSVLNLFLLVLSNANSKTFLNYLDKILLSNGYLKHSYVKVMISRVTIKMSLKLFTKLIFSSLLRLERLTLCAVNLIFFNITFWILGLHDKINKHWSLWLYLVYTYNVQLTPITRTL